MRSFQRGPVLPRPSHPWGARRDDPFAGSTTEAVTELADKLEAGTLTVPAPPEGVKEWPIIGERLHKVWSAASTNLEGTLAGMKPQLAAVGKFMLSAAAWPIASARSSTAQPAEVRTPRRAGCMMNQFSPNRS